MKRRKMRINGLFIFSLIIGTYSLSLNRDKIQADLTENTTTSPSVDIVKRNTGANADSEYTETTVPAPTVDDNIEDNKEQNLSFFEREAANPRFFEDEPTDVGVTTTVNPQSQDSYFARFRARRNAECHAETDNGNPDFNNQDWSTAFCTERAEEKVESETTEVNEKELEAFTEKSLSDTSAYEPTTDNPKYTNIQKINADDTQIESSGQDTNSPTRFQLDLDIMPSNKNKTKRESPSYQNATEENESPAFLEEEETSLIPLLELDDFTTNHSFMEYDYDQFLENNNESPNFAVRLLYGLAYVHSFVHGGTTGISRKISEFFG